MATKAEAAHQMMVLAARRKDSGQRNDLEAGMAKYLASEYAKEVVEDSFRIHGGYGFSKEYEIERLYREVPMLLIGEGTAEIQKMIIGRRLLEHTGLVKASPLGPCRPGDAARHYQSKKSEINVVCHIPQFGERSNDMARTNPSAAPSTTRVEAPLTDEPPVEAVLQELLIEEVSIDGMCGVY